VPDLVQAARDYKLDFITLTDHNTVAPLAQMDSLSADDILTMGGMELTTYYGHALALGTRQWQEWRTHKHTMRELAQAVLDSGALYIIAHPRSVGDPICTGCRWEYTDMMPGIAPAVEVWNGLWDAHNQEGLELYYTWLNDGHKLVMTSGSDIHGQPPASTSPTSGRNVVLADDLTEADILDAIRKGRSYLSSGPELIVDATSGDAQAIVGETLQAHGALHFSAQWASVEDGDTIQLIAEGDVIATIKATQCDHMTWTFEKPAQWYVAEIRASNGDLKAVTNPIWVVQ
jgi:hypothetical protein